MECLFDEDSYLMTLKGTLQQLVVKELKKYLTAQGLKKYGSKSEKFKTISCHVLWEKNIDAIKRKQRDMTASRLHVR